MAIDGNGVLYQLPYPRVSGQLPIRQFNLAVSASLQNPSSYDIGHTLEVIVEDEHYSMILGESSLECFKNFSTDPLLRHVASWSYPDSYRPTRLVHSNQNPESFFVMFEDHSPLRFEVDESELYGMQLIPDSEAISIVVNSLLDDVFVTATSANHLTLFSVFDLDVTRIISLRDYCEQIVSLYSLPAISQDKNVSFIVNCTTLEGTEELFHVIVSHESADTLDIVSIASGVPVSSSSYLALRSGNLMTVYNRLRLSNGVPQSHDFGSEVLKVVVFETDSHTSFLVYTVDGTWTQVNAEEFFLDPSQGIQTLPGMLRGSCDPAVCPYAIVDDGFIVVSQNNLRYDIVLFTFNSSVSTFTETAQVTGLTQSPSFVTFLPDLNAITSPTPSISFSSDPVTPSTSTPPNIEMSTPEITLSPTVSPAENKTISPSEQPQQLVVVLPIILCVVTAAVIVVLIVIIFKKCKKNRFRPQPSKDNGKHLSAPTADKKYFHPTEETGDLEDGQVNTVAQETGSTSNNSAVIDAGYVSALATPLPSVRLLDVSSRQSNYSSSTCISSGDEQNPTAK